MLLTDFAINAYVRYHALYSNGLSPTLYVLYFHDTKEGSKSGYIPLYAFDRIMPLPHIRNELIPLQKIYAMLTRGD